MRKPITVLGEFEQMVLAATLKVDGDAYGVAIIDEIERVIGKRVSSGALSVTLDRLEQKRFIRSRLARPSPERGGRPRRIVKVTAAGRRAMRESRAALMEFWRGLETELEG